MHISVFKISATLCFLPPAFSLISSKSNPTEAKKYHTSYHVSTSGNGNSQHLPTSSNLDALSTHASSQYSYENGYASKNDGVNNDVNNNGLSSWWWGGGGSGNGHHGNGPVFGQLGPFDFIDSVPKAMEIAGLGLLFIRTVQIGTGFPFLFIVGIPLVFILATIIVFLPNRELNFANSLSWLY